MIHFTFLILTMLSYCVLDPATPFCMLIVPPSPDPPVLVSSHTHCHGKVFKDGGPFIASADFFVLSWFYVFRAGSQEFFLCWYHSLSPSDICVKIMKSVFQAVFLKILKLLHSKDSSNGQNSTFRRKVIFECVHKRADTHTHTHSLTGNNRFWEGTCSPRTPSSSSSSSTSLPLLH